MAIPLKFQFPAPTATYSFSDLIQGRAYQTFYPASYVASGATIIQKYFLSPNATTYSSSENRITEKSAASGGEGGLAGGSHDGLR